MNKIVVRNRCNAAWMLFSIAFVFSSAIPSLAQDDPIADARKRQAKMMETQMFMQQLLQLGYSAELRDELEVVGDQLEGVKKMAKDYEREMMEFYKNNGQLGIEIQKLMEEGKTEEAQEMAREYQERNSEFAESYMEK